MIRSISVPRARAEDFQRSMAFIDGTNLFHRLRDAKLALQNGGLQRLANLAVGGRQLVRTYLYTSRPHLEAAKAAHGTDFANGCRILLGDAIPTKDGGNYKEKGVDAMLVADMVYHAAIKNIEYAALVSVDTDFVQALRRVEDFGCRTAAVAVCAEMPERLRETADTVISLDAQALAGQGIAASRMPA